MATLPRARSGAFSFWQKLAIGLSLFIVFCFGQFALRGFVDYARAPLVMHLHGLAMLTWLGLLVTQALLAGKGGPGGLAIHRRLGWASAVMVPTIVVLASALCLTALRLGLFPPFFTPAYFLALVHVDALLFALLVGMAVSRRRQGDWHRRLMAGSTILLMEPALGRLLPMPLIMPWGEWVSMVIQLGVVWLIVRHDRRTLGHTHPATTAAAITVILAHVIVELLAITPPWIALAARFTA
ncbi:MULTISPECIES: hypothetical protein [Sphingomonadaceae]|uniref:hypothetical protein n=1 Tax=Sphingomonadaceae TaxID=41297 RepID=UPI0011594119|nr:MULTISPECIES: hypothetical protein [Sphingomonadaceae]QDK33641.1 hypothetical protein DM450_12830 [Sphingomonas sp. IC081]QSR17659.1 hypothetical protein CA833_10755 [Novosphingobium sp. KA1]